MGAVIGREGFTATYLTHRSDPFAAADRSYKKYNRTHPSRVAVRQFIVEKGNRDDTDSITIELKRTSGAQAKQILEQLLTIDGVQEDASS
ncbi:hypothetical protein [Pseudomonas sp. CFBP 13719]|uniref:hypothetical protein n=1 Tax=Pseudomonas sp. CFBP 13719 TaxID=2775303 RepID=UPI001786F410|nr:hypothetical protein [Pseudomonas sp. CFBP 13719]MBD8682780.1 hypothetical protein [Pseudomonas sp. CFBP 13719]